MKDAFSTVAGIVKGAAEDVVRGSRHILRAAVTRIRALGSRSAWPRGRSGGGAPAVPRSSTAASPVPTAAPDDPVGTAAAGPVNPQTQAPDSTVTTAADPGTPTSKAAPSTKSTTKRSTTKRTPAPKAAPAKKRAPVKKTAAVGAAAAPKVATAKAAPGKKAAPAKQAAPAKTAGKAGAQTAPAPTDAASQASSGDDSQVPRR
ncbi:MAG: hypothetical protein ACR2J5_05590 [Geodermatophilaceae bacterium]